MPLKEHHYQSIKTLIFRYAPVDDETLSNLNGIAELSVLEKIDILLPVGKSAKHIHILHRGAVIAYFLDK